MSLQHEFKNSFLSDALSSIISPSRPSSRFDILHPDTFWIVKPRVTVKINKFNIKGIGSSLNLAQRDQCIAEIFVWMKASVMTRVTTSIFLLVQKLIARYIGYIVLPLPPPRFDLRVGGKYVWRDASRALQFIWGCVFIWWPVFFWGSSFWGNPVFSWSCCSKRNCTL